MSYALTLHGREKKMLKKCLAVGVIGLFIGTALLSASATDNLVSLISGERVSNNLLYDNRSIICTHGPFMPLLNIATINLTAGDPEQIEKIEQILDNRILQFIFPRRRVVNITTGLNFSISYNRDIPNPNTRFFVRFSYHTWIAEDGNESSIGNIKHTVIVKGFEGEFILGRGRLFLLPCPPIFTFLGTCNEATIIT